MDPLRYARLQKRWALLAIAGLLVIIAGYAIDAEVVGWFAGFALIVVAIVAFVLTVVVHAARSRRPEKDVVAVPVPAPPPTPAPPPPPPLPTPSPEPEPAVVDMDIEPARDAVIYGEETWIRWAPVPQATGWVRWRRTGAPEWQTADSASGASMARVAPLAAESSYEYFVEQNDGALAWKSEIRRFRVGRGLTFEPRSVQASVARDYDQTVMLRLRNAAPSPAGVTARALADFDDLPADVVGAGSSDEPVELAPGASIDLRLAVNAADAGRDRYEIPVAAGGATGIVSLTVPRPPLALSLRVLHDDPATLTKQVELRNDGATVADLAIRIAAPAENEARIQPSASHAHLSAGAALMFCVTPLLYLEFESLDAVLECSAAGQTARFPLQFRAPAGKRLLGVRTGSQQTSTSSDWYCTNRPNIMAWLITPDTVGVAWDDISEWVHFVLDIGGGLPLDTTPVWWIPVVFDGANVVIYSFEGNWEEAGWSAMAMIPVLGQGAKATKLGMKVSRKSAAALGRRGIGRALMNSKYAEARDLYRRMQPNRHALDMARRRGLAAERKAIERYYPSYDDARHDTRRLNELLRELDPRDGRTPSIYLADLEHDAHHILEKRILNYPQYQDALRKLGWDTPGKMPSIVLSSEFHRRSPRSLGPGRQPLMDISDPEMRDRVTSLTWLLLKDVDPSKYKNFPELMRAYETALHRTDDTLGISHDIWQRVEPLFDYINRVVPYRTTR